MADEIGRWVCELFEKKGTVPGATLEEKLKTDYFETGLVDSLGVVELIGELEQKYAVRFLDKHFQERRFSTIGGLAEIVSELVAK